MAAAKPSQEPIKDFTQLVVAIDNAKTKYLMGITPQVIETDLKNKLNKHRDEITMKLLGFDKCSYGEWKIDHCNGRAGNSIAGDNLYNRHSITIDAWMATTFKEPQLTKADIDRINKQIKSEVLRNLDYHIRQRINDMTKAKVDELFKNEDLQKFVDDYIKTKDLLQS